MKLFRATLMAAAIAVSASAEPVMKVTLKSGVSDKKISAIAKMSFSDAALLVDKESIPYSDIVSLSFFDDGTSITNFNRIDRPISFGSNGNSLSLSLDKPSMMVVRLYSMNGRVVKELFNGINTGSALNLNYDGVAPGIYSVVIRVGNEMLARKVMIK